VKFAFEKFLQSFKQYTVEMPRKQAKLSDDGDKSTTTSASTIFAGVVLAYCGDLEASRSELRNKIERAGGKFVGTRLLQSVRDSFIV